MKNRLLIIILLLSNVQFAIANFDTRINRQQIEKYELEKEYSNIVLPTDFGKSFIIDDEQLKELNKNEIYKIDLVYTQFKRNKNFDQEALNQNRIKELKQLVPTIDKDAPEWNYVEQTKAKEYVIAESYFHGFVIYYRPQSIDYSDLKKRFEPYQSQLKTFTVDNEQAILLTYSSGTQISIPENAVVNKDGTPVVGEYEIRYNEFRNPAEIALSGLPMKFGKDGANYNFSSIGMYEIKGFQDEKELKLQKPIQVDFNCTKKVNDAAFYQLDEKTNEWKKINDLNANQFGGEQNRNDEMEENQDVELGRDKVKFNNDFDFRIKGNNVKVTGLGQDECKLTFNKKMWRNYQKAKASLKTKYLITETLQKREIVVDSKDRIDIVDAILSEDRRNSREILTVNLMWDSTFFVIEDDGNRETATLLKGGRDKGHKYPNLVKGLNNAEFGVYNCDQIYRVGNPKTIHPVYVDAATNTTINNPDVACLMDLDYNGSFSFDPDYITLNTTGKNAILLFSGDKKVYLVLPEEMDKVNLNTTNPEIRMQDVTAELKTSADLKKMLNL